MIEKVSQQETFLLESFLTQTTGECLFIIYLLHFYYMSAERLLLWCIGGSHMLQEYHICDVIVSACNQNRCDWWVKINWPWHDGTFELLVVLSTESKNRKKRIMEGKRSSGFRRIFTVAFLLFLAPAEDSNPARQ